ncbi:MAG TPA: nicotinate-nucleotide adenylyltransferase [Spirochaetota bacterium]|nr:nicotinate-nucleotide adenylyltransferase [Spirochaetota bacterium]
MLQNRIAIFGGTFNPVHNGHLQNASHIADEFQLDRILFVPAKIPVHKRINNDPGPEERSYMLSLAIRADSRFELSTLEIERNSESYSIYTVRSVIKNYPDSKIFFIVGSDSFNTITGWKNYGELISLVHFIVMKRPGDSIREEVLDIIPSVSIAKNVEIDVSSTKIREFIKEKKDCAKLLPDKVLSYINEKEFYLL